MSHYENFKTVVYIPAQVAASFTNDTLQRDYDFLEKYVGLDKVYLETHRGSCDVAPEQILMIKTFLEDNGVEVSGGITTTFNDFDGAQKGKRRLFETICYTDPAMRKRIKEVSEYTASIFEEVILDDFFFTGCTCESCIKEKGDRDWVTFRRELMKDVSENLIVGPAKAVNPHVKMVIKYPNWRESYHFTGYVPEVQRDIFDATYTGTETRSPAYTDQHLPEYLSYSLVRWMDNAWPERNGGGWFDVYQCWSVDRYLEQAYLTCFSGAKEIMMFQWGDLINNPFAAPLKLQFGRIDSMIKTAGSPEGIPVYIPFASSGENHLEMRLGMLGLPMEPTPFFPENGGKLLLTKSALADPDIIRKLAAFVENGGDAVITSGFFAGAQEALRGAGLTEAVFTGRKYMVTRYHVTSDEGGYIDDQKPVMFPEIVHANNASWSLLNGGDGDLHASLFLRGTYGKGRLYILAVPDNDADLYRVPAEAADVMRRALSDDVYVSGSGVSVFTYDDGSIILYRYVKDDLHTVRVTLHSKKETKTLVNVETDDRIEVKKVTVFEDFESYDEWQADVLLTPGQFIRLRRE
ncbi:MAG: hypothetical protein K6C95_02965 [Lachnospiraceae bacterium]|nr:hypothetical protein [Lachnospiraceae bacterium]